ncbi:MAG: methyltransferase domain-containing protein [Bacteroidetes bacterium]|nr:methyltransferase domain-containing protein [Bacteroidota bacterium]
MQSAGSSSPHWIMVWFAGMLALVVATGRMEFVNAPYLQGFGWIAGLYLLAFLGYAMILRAPENRSIFRMAIALGIILRVGLVFCYPNLSDDYYRYIWDGRLWVEGVNPMDMLPSEWMAKLGPDQVGDWQFLFDHLNSKQYYTVYPPVLQGLFAMAARISGGDVYLAVVVLKSFILLAEIGSIWIMTKLTKRLNLPRKAVLVYALNPMVVLELIGNCHFEALMIFFVLAAMWLLMKWGILPAAPLLALAIGTKLLPVLIFPFLIRRMGWWRTLAFGMLTLACCLPMFWWMLDGDRLAHFQESLRLYFHSFEFNGGPYYAVRSVLGYWANRILPWLMLGLILVSAWRERNRVWTGLPAAMMLALTLYQLHSPVIHPWYITPLIAMAALSPYRYPVVWSFFLPLTYVAYFMPGEVRESGLLILVEYGLLFAYVAYEWIFRRQRLTLTEWILRSNFLRRQAQKSIPARLKIKQARISKHLQKGERILDIGTGNGGLCRALRLEGLEIQPLDVANLSYFPEVQAKIYDGNTFPFPEKSFDTSLMITMLHHTPDPEKIVLEAIRVTKGRLVIMEDIYRNKLQQQLTYFTDSLVNLEFEGHPHTNKTDAEWQALFKDLDLKLVYREEFRTLVFFTQVIYVLELADRSDDWVATANKQV